MCVCVSLHKDRLIWQISLDPREETEYKFRASFHILKTVFIAICVHTGLSEDSWLHLLFLFCAHWSKCSQLQELISWRRNRAVHPSLGIGAGESSSGILSWAPSRTNQNHPHAVEALY